MSALNTASGFSPPPYPYTRLARLAETARRHAGGMVDLSIGTPCDPAPHVVLETMARSRSEHGYPSSVGAEALRRAATRWMKRRFGVDVDPERVAACVGTKEMVASTAWYLRLRDPKRDTVVGPKLAYPTYEMGAQLAGCTYFGVPSRADGTLDLEQVPDEVSARAVVSWVNSPSNPTGSLCDLREAAAWGRARQVPVFCDECYVEFTWSPNAPATILKGGSDGVVAVHSLSKRSNMAGMRVGFYAGDEDIVRYLAAVRQHAGLMVPGPVQEAAVAALDDDEHVEVQRARYLERLERLAGMFRGVGLRAELPEGGFYLWVPAPDWAHEGPAASGERTSSWVLAEALADVAGTLVSPGDLYAPEGSGFVRVAAVQPEGRIELVAKRLAEAGSLRRK